MAGVREGEQKEAAPVDPGLIEALARAYHRARLIELERRLGEELDRALECLKGRGRLDFDEEARLHLTTHLPALEAQYPMGPAGPDQAQIILGLAAFFACCQQAPKITMPRLVLVEKHVN